MQARTIVSRKTSMQTTGLPPRKAAIDLLDRVLDDGKLLSELLPGALEKLDPADRARAGRLATNTLRWMDRADRILGRHLAKKPPTTVMNVLRLGVVEICLDESAAHGVVNSAVEIVRGDRDFSRMSGMVNAVLRKVAQGGPDTWQQLPKPQLPKWLRKPLIADYGKASVLALEAAHANAAPLDLSVKSDPQMWAERLSGQVLETGTVRVAGHPQVTALPGFESGDWWVQDAAAALPAKILNVQPGERVLDMCAAPGGKTLQLAQSGASVTALDVSKSRVKRLQENLDRCRLPAEIVVADALAFDAPEYDAILLDAPCSATGTIRRHPDLPYAKDGSEFPKLFALQQNMIDRAWYLLKPGGRLLFCTCSLLFDEGEEQIKDAMLNHPGMVVDLDAVKNTGASFDGITEYGLRILPSAWPEIGGIDGFFITLLRKPA